MPIKRMWGGRFEEAGDQLVNQFNASISFDQEMAQEDIEGSLAHVKMLKETQILSADDADKIIAGLKKLRERLTSEGLPHSLNRHRLYSPLLSFYFCFVLEHRPYLVIPKV